MTTSLPPRCPECAADVRRVHRDFVHRRGDRSITVRGQLWECAAPEAHGGEPYRFADAALMRANDAIVRETWRARFGEELPAIRVPRHLREAARIGLIIGRHSRDATDATVEVGPRPQTRWGDDEVPGPTLTVAV